MGLGSSPPLQVLGFEATRASDAERGPLVRLRSEEARRRLLNDGELAWVYGPRRHDLAEVRVDESIPRGGVVVRDVAGVTASEVVRIYRLDTDRPVGPTRNV